MNLREWRIYKNFILILEEKLQKNEEKKQKKSKKESRQEKKHEKKDMKHEKKDKKRKETTKLEFYRWLFPFSPFSSKNFYFNKVKF